MRLSFLLRIVLSMSALGFVWNDNSLNAASLSPPLIFEAENMQRDVTNNADYTYFEDYVEPLSVIQRDDLFQPFNRYTNEGGAEKDQFWLHFNIETAEAGQQTYWLLSRQFPYESAYYVYANGSEIVRSDRIIQKQVGIGRAGFSLDSVPSEATDLYLMFENVLIADRVADFRVVSSDVHQSIVQKELVISSIFLSIIVGCFIYLLVLQSKMPDPIILSLLVFLVMLGIHTVVYSGANWNLFSIDTTLFYWRLNGFALGMLLASNALILSQLMAKQEAGILIAVLNDMLILLATLSAIPVLIVPSGQLMLSLDILNGVAVFVSAGLFIITVTLVLRNYRPARYFLYAFSPIFIGASYRIYIIQANMPQEPYIFPYATIIGCIIFVLVIGNVMRRIAQGELRL